MAGQPAYIGLRHVMTMTEKVARAIALSQKLSDWKDFLDSARAAVLALSAPPVDMLDMALPDCAYWGYLPDHWSAMIAYVANE